MAKKVTVSDLPNTEFINNAEVLGQLIKAKRTKLGIKMADCAALCGIGINTLSRLENGNANCTLAAMFSVLNGLGIKLTTNMLVNSGSQTDAAHSITTESEWV
ncbi:helix-turn-helix domain-containing protein [Catenovulum agarivorans]|uniref:helix-turn-helix domain-containing protein n=1 Tax=Catenovulum agarivorans TaxID=1172192 RepID=UPI000368C185|nr:helix-turn-helix domain-containing protein [Catenovulum agarivorans]